MKGNIIGENVYNYGRPLTSVSKNVCHVHKVKTVCIKQIALYSLKGKISECYPKCLEGLYLFMKIDLLLYGFLFSFIASLYFMHIKAFPDLAGYSLWFDDHHIGHPVIHDHSQSCLMSPHFCKLCCIFWI